MIIGIEIWLHAHAETGEPSTWDLLSVTGERIPNDLLESLWDDTINGMDTFGEFEPENAYSVVLVVDHCGDCWHIESLEGKLKLPNQYDGITHRQPTT
jgi:hypothetical protein